MNMNKTILATLITTVFSSNVIAQGVDVELANLETEKAIQSQMGNIDAATLAKLNAQNNKVVELNGEVYEQDESGVWKAIGTGALGLTAALFSGSSSSSANNLLDTPDYEQGAIKPSIDNKPGLPDVDNGIPRDINLITHGDTAYIYANGEEVRSATLDVTSEGNYTITGSEGAMFHVTGNDLLVTMVNGESVKLHNVNRIDDRNISFSVEGENYNLHRTYSGEVWVQKEQGNGTGNWATVKTGADVLANIQERQLINAIDKTLPDVDNKPIQPDNDLKAQWSIGEDEKGRKALMNNGEVVAYVANDGTRLRNGDNEPLGVITSSVNGNGATTYSVTLNNNSQFEGATITFREGNVGNKNMTFTSADGQTTYHWRHDRGFYKVDIDNNWGVVPDTDNSPILPDVDNSPIKDNPALPEWESETQLKTVEINGTTYLVGFITGAGEDARHVDITGFGKNGNNAIRLNGSEGNDVRVITHDGEIAELRINGQVITKDYLNGKDRLPVADNSPILPEIDGGEGVKELSIIDGGIFFGGKKIGFIASDGNVNLYKHGKVGTAVYNGEGTLTAIKGDNGRELALRDDRVTLVGERGSVTMIREDGSIRIDHNYTNLVEDGADVKQLAKNIDRSKLQNIKTKVMSKLAK